MGKSIHTARSTLAARSDPLQLFFIQILTGSLQDIIRTTEQMIKESKQELALAAEGSLHIHLREGSVQFGHKAGGHSPEAGITGDPGLVHTLARKAYLEGTIRALEKDVSRCKGILGSMQNAREDLALMRKLDRFDRAGLDLTRILFTREQNEWIDEAYTPNPFHPEHRRYQTGSGVLMRSNAEIKIGNMLETMGIPYRYDDIVTIAGRGPGEAPYKDSYFADFKAPNLLGGITIHEHFGAFQVESYSADALRRLNDYRSFPIEELPGRPVRAEEVTWSFGSDVFDRAKLKRVIQRMLLPLH